VRVWHFPGTTVVTVPTTFVWVLSIVMHAEHGSLVVAGTVMVMHLGTAEYKPHHTHRLSTHNVRFGRCCWTCSRVDRFGDYFLHVQNEDRSGAFGFGWKTQSCRRCHCRDAWPTQTRKMLSRLIIDGAVGNKTYAGSVTICACPTAINQVTTEKIIECLNNMTRHALAKTSLVHYLGMAKRIAKSNRRQCARWGSRIRGVLESKLHLFHGTIAAGE
jgi:hypothetical protein